MVTKTRYQMISGDSHVNPPHDMWSRYLPSKFAEKTPKLESTDEGDFVVFEGRRTPHMVLGALAGRKAEDYALTGKANEARPGGWDPKERIKDMELDGIDAEVLYGGGPLNSQDPELRLASYSAYNDWLADFCASAPERYIGMAYLPMEDVETAIAETRRAITRGLKGVVIPAIAPGAPYSDPSYDAFWTTLEEMDVAAHMHLGARNYVPEDNFNFLVNCTMSKFAIAEPVVHFIYSGLFQRHPKLRLGYIEASVGWAAFLVNYMDHLWPRHRYWTKSTLEEPPSFYFRRQTFGTFLDDPVGVRERHTIGIDNIMWISDYPHSETTWPDSKKLVQEQFKDVPEDEKHKLIAGNAVSIYRLQ